MATGTRSTWWPTRPPHRSPVRARPGWATSSSCRAQRRDKAVMRRGGRVAAAGVVSAVAVTALFLVPAPFSGRERLEALGLAALLSLGLQLHIDVVEGSRASVGNAVAIAV